MALILQTVIKFDLLKVPNTKAGWSYPPSSVTSLPWWSHLTVISLLEYNAKWSGELEKKDGNRQAISSTAALHSTDSSVCDINLSIQSTGQK